MSDQGPKITDPLEQIVESTRYSDQAFATTEQKMEHLFGSPALEKAVKLCVEEVQKVMCCLYNLRITLDNLENSDANKALDAVIDRKKHLLAVVELANKIKSILNAFKFVLSRYRSIQEAHQQPNFQPSLEYSDGVISILRTFSQQMIDFTPGAPVHTLRDWAIFDPESDAQKYLEDLNNKPHILISQNIERLLPEIYTRLDHAFQEIIVATNQGLDLNAIKVAAQASILGDRMQGVSDSLILVEAGVLSEFTDHENPDNSFNIKGAYLEVIRDWEDTMARFFYECFHLQGQNIVFLLQSIKLSSLKKLLQDLQQEHQKIVSKQQYQRKELSTFEKLLSQVQSIISLKEQESLAKEQRETQTTRTAIEGKIVEVKSALEITVQVKNKIPL